MAILTGILIFLLGIVHIVFGEYSQIPDLLQHLDDPIIIGSIRVMIYQGGVILLGVGVVQFMKGIKRIKLRGAAAFIPLGLIVLNILTLIIVGLVFDTVVIRVAMPQLIVFIIIILLMALELRSEVTGDKR